MRNVPMRLLLITLLTCVGWGLTAQEDGDGTTLPPDPIPLDETSKERIERNISEILAMVDGPWLAHRAMVVLPNTAISTPRSFSTPIATGTVIST